MHKLQRAEGWGEERCSPHCWGLNSLLCRTASASAFQAASQGSGGWSLGRVDMGDAHPTAPSSRFQLEGHLLREAPLDPYDRARPSVLHLACLLCSVSYNFQSCYLPVGLLYQLSLSPWLYSSWGRGLWLSHSYLCPWHLAQCLVPCRHSPSICWVMEQMNTGPGWSANHRGWACLCDIGWVTSGKLLPLSGLLPSLDLRPTPLEGLASPFLNIREGNESWSQLLNYTLNQLLVDESFWW